MKKLIFLDIDGVLNNLNTLFNRVHRAKSLVHEDNMIDQTCIRELNRLVDTLECEVVLSSSWRIVYSLESINALLKRHGATFTVIDKTPSIGGKRIRGDEIKKYLSECQCKNVRYVILDDDSDMLDEQKEFFQQINPETGLTNDDVVEIINKFKRDCGEVGESHQTVNLVPRVE